MGRAADVTPDPAPRLPPRSLTTPKIRKCPASNNIPGGSDRFREAPWRADARLLKPTLALVGHAKRTANCTEAVQDARIHQRQPPSPKHRRRRHRGAPVLGRSDVPKQWGLGTLQRAGRVEGCCARGRALSAGTARMHLSAPAAHHLPCASASLPASLRPA